jgi:hypothetical protein
MTICGLYRVQSPNNSQPLLVRSTGVITECHQTFVSGIRWRRWCVCRPSSERVSAGGREVEKRDTRAGVVDKLSKWVDDARASPGPKITEIYC